MTYLEHRSTSMLARGHRHPTGLPALVSIEMWERFSFYGMQAILVFYLYASDGLGLSKQDATAIIGAYGAFVYLATIAGGWTSDHLFGPERTLLGGACAVMVGHLILSLVPGSLGATLGLLAIGAGSGLLKTCAVTTLGMLYRTDDPTQRPHIQLKKDQGFQLFYLGIQLGAMMGPIITGYLADRYSWQIGFSAAATLMAVGLALYGALRPRMYAELSPETLRLISTPNQRLGRAATTRTLAMSTCVASAIGLAAYLRLISASLLSTVLLITVLVAVVLVFVTMFRSPAVTPEEKAKLRSFVPLFIAGAVFWSVSYQNFGVFAVYSDVHLNRMLGSFEIPAAWIQTLNPILVMALAFPVATLWTVRAGRPSTSTQMVTGVILSGIAFLVFLPFVGGAPGTTPLLAMVAVAVIIALGELLIGPVGMAATADYAPQAHRTTFSSLYFLTFAVGMAASGRLSTLYHPDDPAAESRYFLLIAVGTVAVGATLWAWSRKLARS